MAYVKITLQFLGNEYDVEVDNSSSPEELCKLFINELKSSFPMEGEYRLMPVDSLEMKTGTTWELTEVSPKPKVRSFVPRST